VCVGQADVWSYGVCMWELLTGCVPFDGMESNQASRACACAYARTLMRTRARAHANTSTDAHAQQQQAAEHPTALAARAGGLRHSAREAPAADSADVRPIGRQSTQSTMRTAHQCNRRLAPAAHSRGARGRLGRRPSERTHATPSVASSPLNGRMQRRRLHAAPTRRRAARWASAVAANPREVLAAGSAQAVKPRCDPSPGADVGTVPAQMWASPGADVDESRHKMWTSRGADVGAVPAQSRCTYRSDWLVLSFCVQSIVRCSARHFERRAAHSLSHWIPCRAGYIMSQDTMLRWATPCRAGYHAT
jgi:hypothetical protein